MATIKAKGHEFNSFQVKDSFSRRAVQYRNTIIATLRKLDLTEDDIDIPADIFAMKKAPASASWYMDGHFLYYSYNAFSKYVENLYVVSKVIEFEVNALLEERQTVEEFLSKFSEDKDIEDQRKEARKVLGLDLETRDLDLINKKYKVMAKEHHPDMPNGNLEKFKAINKAHKTLKRELE